MSGFRFSSEIPILFHQNLWLMRSIQIQNIYLFRRAVADIMCDIVSKLTGRQ